MSPEYFWGVDFRERLGVKRVMRSVGFDFIGQNPELTICVSVVEMERNVMLRIFEKILRF